MEGRKQKLAAKTLVKYSSQSAFSLPQRTWPSNILTKAPIWCSVDLRDGNQSLPTPMGLAAKTLFFQRLCAIGFKEIEIGFPAASETEAAFCRKLIAENLIPEDVTVQVLVPARPDLIKQTFECLRGVKSAIIHLYNSTSPAQRTVVFQKSKEEVIELALIGIRQIINCAKAQPETHWRIQYSPESFSQTEPAFAFQICSRVCDTLLHEWGRPDSIINLPATVEVSSPNQFADQVEYVLSGLKAYNPIIFSVHTHNDRGCAVAATELALLAGVQRVEGTLFGNGERTGNADLVTLALNLFSQGIDPELDFSNLPQIIRDYTTATGLQVPPRHPYAGEFVFTAFSGSHQDAIAKGLRAQSLNPSGLWDVPYLPLDPKDVGRAYEPIIRINSQSGKGGTCYIIENVLNIPIPKEFQPLVGKWITHYSDQLQRELNQDEVIEAFRLGFLGKRSTIQYCDHCEQTEDFGITLTVTLKIEEAVVTTTSEGSGVLDAFVRAVSKVTSQNYEIRQYQSFSQALGTQADALAWVELTSGQLGVGIHPSIDVAAFCAVLNAIAQQPLEPNKFETQ